MNLARKDDEFLKKLKDVIVEGDYDATAEITEQALEAGVAPEALMKEAISEGITELEQKLFGSDKVWLHPVFLFAMEGIRRSLEILEPLFKPKEEEMKGTVVLGTPAGDTHDLGAKMVALALTAAGFKVVYLGSDVPLTQFINSVNEANADVLCISSYQTSGFERIKEILSLLDSAKLRDKMHVIIGGTVITEKFADQLKVAYGKHASDAVRLANEYIRRKPA